MRQQRISSRREETWFLLTLLAIAGCFSLVAAAAGRQLLISGHCWPPDILWGADVGRTISSMTEPGVMDRTNVHPLFSYITRPLTALIRLAGITPGISAVLLNAAAGATGLLLLAAYLRLRGVRPVDALLGVLVMASSSTWLFQTAVPGTFIFSLCVIGASHLLLIWTLRRPGPALSPRLRWTREALWVLTGLLNYGITVTNGFMSFLAYGFGRRGARGWLRACLYGAVVLGIGVALHLLAGSATYYKAETDWLYDNPKRGFTPYNPLVHSFTAGTIWSYVAPAPVLNRTPDARHWVCMNFLRWDYTAWGWVLVSAWIALLAAAVYAILADRAPNGRRLSAALAACLAFHVLIHTFYFATFEGAFMFTGHALFLSAGLIAPLLARLGGLGAAPRWALRLGLLAFVAALAVRNMAFLYHIRHIVPLPPGFGGN